MSLSLYPIIRKLGEGGFGTTYLATNTLMPSQPYCVVKQLTPTSADPKVQQLIKDRFKQEAITLEHLGKDSNGKVPSLYAYFVERGEFYLIQEYVDGQTLNERVQTRGLFTEIQVRQLLTDILPTLCYVHDRGIVHRDIKPDNIMLRHRDNKPILIDFGAVKEIMSTTITASGDTAQSILIGTPGFMPLEQMSGRPMFASDIYALGLTALYLLTGKMPTEIETDPDRGNLNWQSLAPNISPQLVEILTKSIQPLSRDRYQNARQMLEDLSISSSPFPQPPVVSPIPIADDREKTVYVPIATTTTNGNSQARPLIIALTAAIVGGGLIGGFLVLGHNSSRNESSENKNNSQQTVANNNPVINSTPKITSTSNSTNDRRTASSRENTTENIERNNIAIRENITENTDRSNVASRENTTENIERSNASTSKNTIDNTDRDPRATVRDYYSKINNRNYTGAWNALPTDLQNNKSVHPNGYDSFLDWWAKQVANVEIQQTNLVSQTDRDAVVDVTIEYVMRAGGVSPQRIRYFLVKDDRNQEWAIQRIGLR
ncbi:serine/threonine-protein kinase [Chamaesiphon minutus]|uniref:non-specific serine/threonine protein kinase n=1 Tax=Chamaesiphon minutus (strain ATCC 27169 / PCC 6605) TaxID=1173020 RepID=K9UK77_CHAP6|nr:serine/threonine-protein kinase [Chamaesiphon minutus]AFY95220.1 serine/threonine protein kinase [Chamaesiphon minutus PCC 6605]